jgi:hypothetical protein
MSTDESSNSNVDHPVLTFEQIMGSPPVVDNTVTSGPTVVSEPPVVVPITLEELMESYDAKVAQEDLDKATVAALLNESSDSLRISLLQWASTRFQAAYIIKRITLNIPSVCSDGVTRTVSEYFMYCLGTDMVGLLERLKAKVEGIQFGYSFENNTLRIHVSKC